METTWHHLELGTTWTTLGYHLGQLGDHLAEFENCMDNTGESIGNSMDTTWNNMDTTLGQFWHINGTTLRHRWYKIEKNFEQLWDNCDTTLTQLCHKFDKSLTQVWDRLNEVLRVLYVTEQLWIISVVCWDCAIYVCFPQPLVSLERSTKKPMVASLPKPAFGLRMTRLCYPL